MAETVYVKIDGDAKGLDRAAKQAERAVGGFSRQVEATRRTAMAAEGVFGNMAGRFEHLGAAASALGGTGGPLLLAGAAITAVGYASIRAAASLVGMAKSAADMADELREAGHATENLADLSAAFDDLEDATAGLKAELVSLYSDALTDVVAGTADAVRWTREWVDENGDLAITIGSLATGLVTLSGAFRTLFPEGGATEARNQATAAAEAARQKALEAKETAELAALERRLFDMRLATMRGDAGRRQMIIDHYDAEIGKVLELSTAEEESEAAHAIAMRKVEILEAERAAKLKALTDERIADVQRQEAADKAAADSRARDREKELADIQRIAGANETAALAAIHFTQQVAVAEHERHARRMQMWEDQMRAQVAGLAAMSAGNAAFDAANKASHEQAQTLISDTAAAYISAASTISVTALGLFEESKATAMAEAIINGAAAIVRQFADLPWPAALATSASVAAMTAIQVAKIASTEPGSSGAPTAPGGSTPTSGLPSGFESSGSAPTGGGSSASTQRTAGGGSGAVVVAMGGRFYDIATGDALGRDSVLTRRLERGRHTGQNRGGRR